MGCPLFVYGEPSVARGTVEGSPLFEGGEAPSAQRERHPSISGEGRLRRGTVEGSPLFEGGEARVRSASAAYFRARTVISNG
jgi:hypothetical protein